MISNTALRKTPSQKGPGREGEEKIKKKLFLVDEKVERDRG